MILDCPEDCPARRLGCQSGCNRYKLAAIVRGIERRRRMQTADRDDFMWSEKQSMIKRRRRKK